MEVITERLARLERDILAIVKSGAQTMPGAISAFVLDRMDYTQSKKAKGGRRVLPRNTGNRLRTLYGNLTRALTPGELGNISNVTTGGSKLVTVEFGFDENTKVKQGPRVGDLRYGLTHEYGDTIPHPGGTAYRVVNGKARFVSNEKAQAYYAKTGKQLPRTKAHTITIPARPYLRPGFKDFMDDPKGYAAFMDELVIAVRIKLGAR